MSQFQNWIEDKFVHQNSVFFWTILSLCKLKVRNALLIAGWEKLFTFHLRCKKEWIEHRPKEKLDTNCIEYNEVH